MGMQTSNSQCLQFGCCKGRFLPVEVCWWFDGICLGRISLHQVFIFCMSCHIPQMGISLAGVSLTAILETLNYFMFVQCIRRVKQHTKVLCFFFSLQILQLYSSLKFPA